MLALALFEPEIPQNTGTLIRLCACFDLTIHVIEPCGFLWNDKKLSRSVMDYAKISTIIRHLSFDHFKAWIDEQKKRLVLIDVQGESACWSFTFSDDDVLMLGKESCGVNDRVKAACNTSVFIPQKKGRSLNVATAASIIVGEAVRQLRF
ncbi:MAG: tRNA (cytidine(34)-2'-O)-methyltransferase [Holosporales bacterium]